LHDCLHKYLRENTLLIIICRHRTFIILFISHIFHQNIWLIFWNRNIWFCHFFHLTFTLLGCVFIIYWTNWLCYSIHLVFTYLGCGLIILLVCKICRLALTLIESMICYPFGIMIITVFWLNFHYMYLFLLWYSEKSIIFT